MQKVITITTTTNVLTKDKEHIAREYPEINEYLDVGYVVSNLVPVTLPVEGAYKYSLTFVLSDKYPLDQV